MLDSAMLNSPAQVNIFLNEHPEPGQKLTIRYNTAATKMYGMMI
jgi:hypothetical protein